jgi:lipopolysaccharide/colanic/teichoic acid biosynthesis glycosyltransferase
MNTVEVDINQLIKEKISLSDIENDYKTMQFNSFWIAKHIAYQNKKPFQQIVKKLIDFSGSFVGLIMLVPLFAAVALIIKIDSKGPVLYKQERLGQFGKKFYMYKFRSMVVDAEDMLDNLKNHNQTNEGMFKMYDDPRITKVGKFIRKYSIDELPQLYNVLKGEMSLVGFRPPLEEELKSYKTWHYVRFAFLPGLTGVWQTSGRSKITDFDKVIEMDYKYVNTWNILLDLIILLKTIPVVILGKDSA